MFLSLASASTLLYNRGMPDDRPLVEYDARVEREIVLRKILERRALLMAAGKHFTWSDLCQGLTVVGMPVTQYQIRNWRATTWGREIEENFKVQAQETIQELFDGNLAAAVEEQLRLSREAPEHKDRISAFGNVIKLAKDIGYIRDTIADTAAKPPNIQILIQQYSDPVALARNITPVLSGTATPQEPKQAPQD